MKSTLNIKKARLGIAGFMFAIAATLLAPPAHAVTAAESFADGNRLFRDDLYWAALLRYRQAAEAGMDTPLLHYNTGVANYKAGQYDRANESLLKASKTPQIRPISHYNLGLNAHAAGNDEEALRWFRRARDQEQSPQIRKLAIRAITALRRQEAVVDPVVVRVRSVSEPKSFTEFDVYARAGFGNDNNVYKTPSESYIDISNRNLPVAVDPVVQTGTYYPVAVGAKYSVNSFEHESFFGRYRLSGHFYQDEALQNADEYVHELAFGTDYERREENRESILSSAFTVAQHKETYFDPDDGVERSLNGNSIGDRLSYLRYGPEIRTRQSWQRFSFNLWGKAQLWNYDTTTEVPEYDNEYMRLGGNVQYRFTQTSLLRLSAEAYSRNYSDRPSYELDGTQPIGNPPVEYGYTDYGVTARQRISRGVWFGVKYTRTERTDGHVGYNDYTRDNYGVEIKLRAGSRFRLAANAVYRVYNYENAFAFNNPAAERKTLESLQGKVVGSLTFDWNLTLVGEYLYRDVDSNDLRIQYDRSLFMLSLQWNYD